MSNIIWHNGEFKGESAPIFTALDRIRLGDGVFDTMLVIIEDGNSAPTPATSHHSTTSTSSPSNAPSQLIHPELHLSQILHNANILGMEEITVVDNGEISTIELQSAAEELIAKNNLTPGHYALNTIISRGPAARGLALPDNPDPQIIMRLSPLPDEFPPVHAIISQTVRRNEGSPLSRIKSCNYGDNILALKEATEKGANEAIMLNNQGHITCASIGNIFAIIDGALTTPPLEDGAIDGVTRKLIIQRMDVREQSFTASDLASAQGIYITNSLRGARPVVTLDGQAIPQPSLPINKNFHLE